MLKLRTTFNGNGELIDLLICSPDKMPATYEYKDREQTMWTECPDMRTALVVAAAWERTGYKP